MSQESVTTAKEFLDAAIYRNAEVARGRDEDVAIRDIDVLSRRVTGVFELRDRGRE